MSLQRIKSARSSKALLNKKKTTNKNSVANLTSLSEISPDNFIAFFPFSCENYNCKIIPTVQAISLNDYKSETNFDTLNSTASKATDLVQKNITKPIVVACYDNVDKKDTLLKVVFKNFVVGKRMIQALENSLDCHRNLECLKFDNSSLRADTFDELYFLLKKHLNIKEVIVDKNPHCDQSFDLLLGKSCNLRYVSFRLCQINDQGMAKIAEKLTSYESQLQVLNLASNYISDMGIKSLASALRINRTLISINLANNLITDVGCIALGNILEKFPLTFNEIVIRRRKIMARLLLKQQMIKDYMTLSQSHTPLVSKLSSSKGKSGIASARSSTPTKQKKTSIVKGSNASEASTRNAMALRDQMFENKLPKENHPFVKDAYAENGQIICYGNFNLGHLNLACKLLTPFAPMLLQSCRLSPKQQTNNKITQLGIQHLIDIMQYQLTMITQIGMLGLLHLIIVGNLIPQHAEEYTVLGDVLLLKTKK